MQSDEVSMVSCCLSWRNLFKDEVAFMAALAESAAVTSGSLLGEFNGH